MMLGVNLSMNPGAMGMAGLTSLLDSFTLILTDMWQLGLIFALTMFTAGMSIDQKNNYSSFINKRPIGIALLIIYIINPLATWLFAWFLDLGPSLTLALMLVASCPGGRFFPVFTYFSRGEVSLSLCLHTTITALSFLFTPIIFLLLTALSSNLSNSLVIFKESYFYSVLNVLLVFLLPFLLGRLTQAYFKQLTFIVYPAFKVIAFFFILLVISISIYLNVLEYYRYIGIYALVAVTHNIFIFVISFSLAKGFNLSLGEIKAVTFSTTTANFSLMLFFIVNYFAADATLVAFVGVWCYVYFLRHFILSLFWWHYSNVKSNALRLQHSTL